MDVRRRPTSVTRRGIALLMTAAALGAVVDEGVAQVTAPTDKPLFMGETASPETGGDKAAWINGLFATLDAHPEIRGFTWFHFDKETNWRIDSSATSLEAFRAGLATY